MKATHLIGKPLAIFMISINIITFSQLAIADSESAQVSVAQNSITANSLLNWYNISSVDDFKKLPATKNIVFTFNPHFSPEQAQAYLNRIPDESIQNLGFESKGISTELNAKTFQKFLGKTKNQFGFAVVIGQGIVLQQPDKNTWGKLLKTYKPTILIEYASPSVYFVAGKHTASCSAYINDPTQAQALGKGVIASKSSFPRDMIISGNATNLSVFSKELQHEKKFYDGLKVAFELQTVPTTAEAQVLASTIYHVNGFALDFNANPSSNLINSFAQGFTAKSKKMANTFGIGLPVGMDVPDFSPIYDAYAKANEEIRPNKMFRIIGNTFKATDPGINQYLFKDAIYRTQSLDPAWVDIIKANKLKGVSLFSKKFKVDLNTTIKSGLPYVLAQTESSKNILIINDKKILQWHAGYVKAKPEQIKVVASAEQLKPTLQALGKNEAVRVPSNLVSAAFIKQVDVPFIAVRDDQGDLMMKPLSSVSALDKTEMNNVPGHE